MGGNDPCKRVKALFDQGRLDEQIIADALSMRESDFVYAALACLAGTNLATVKKIFALHAARPVVALAWRAGLSMRFALRLQKELGQVQPRDLINPREGTDYPLTREELFWQLDFFGIKKD